MIIIIKLIKKKDNVLRYISSMYRRSVWLLVHHILQCTEEGDDVTLVIHRHAADILKSYTTVQAPDDDDDI